jgi:hypothetical protein
MTKTFRNTLGKAPPPAFEWASLGIYHLSEMRGTLFDTSAHLFCEEGAATPDSQAFKSFPIARF